MLANNTSYEDSFTTCQITPGNHGSLLDSLLNMQLASRNPFSGQIVADYCFCQGLLAHPLQHALWLSPALSHNFRGTFAKISLFTEWTEGKANTRGLGVWPSQSLTFGNLATAFGACFLRLQKASLGSDSGRCRSMAFGCREASLLEARLLPMKGVIVRKHHHTGNWTRTKPKFSSALLLPDPGRQRVAALDIMIIISNFRETFAKKMLLSRKKTFARVSNKTCTAFAIKIPYKDL